MSLLIDADFYVYKTCQACEEEIDWGDDNITVVSKHTEIRRMLKREFAGIARKYDVEESDLHLFFSSSNNFRKKIAESYKGHRNRRKPCGYIATINWLAENYKVTKIDTLEADDILGIYATKYADQNHIVISPDKDLRQIPGLLDDTKSDAPVYITPEEGRRWHLIQTMSGDATDGYAGIPGYGVKKSVTLLDEKGYTWETVEKAFIDRDLTAEDALTNARLAKILTKDEFDFDTKKPILWNPTT
jgi:DNA polymerase-1